MQQRGVKGMRGRNRVVEEGWRRRWQRELNGYRPCNEERLGRHGLLGPDLVLELVLQHGGVGLGGRVPSRAALHERHLELGRLLLTLLGPLVGLFVLLVKLLILGFDFLVSRKRSVRGSGVARGAGIDDRNVFGSEGGGVLVASVEGTARRSKIVANVLSLVDSAWYCVASFNQLYYYISC